MKNISDNVHTDMVSLSYESECVMSCNPCVQNISGNVYTDMVSLSCEFECVLSVYFSV